MKISQEQIKNMLPGQVLIAKCESASEWESAKRIAYKMKAAGRDDGNSYIVKQNAADMTVSIETTNVK